MRGRSARGSASPIRPIRSNVFHVFYGRLFTPPNLEAISFAKLNTAGTKAAPDDTTNNTVRAERAHYFEVGSYHALSRWATVELTGYYKLAHFLSDAGQFGTTPLLNFFAFERGWQRGIDGALKLQMMDNLTARGNVAWGQCKGYGLQSGHVPAGSEGDQRHQFQGRGVLRSLADADEFRRWLPIVSWNGRLSLARCCMVGLAYGGRARCKTNSTHSLRRPIYNAVAHARHPFAVGQSKDSVGL